MHSAGLREPQLRRCDSACTLRHPPSNIAHLPVEMPLPVAFAVEEGVKPCKWSTVPEKVVATGVKSLALGQRVRVGGGRSAGNARRRAKRSFTSLLGCVIHGLRGLRDQGFRHRRPTTRFQVGGIPTTQLVRSNVVSLTPPWRGPVTLRVRVMDRAR